jgi:NTP pyrophosphatase (non-canonical NTP hydrolase)
MSSPTEPVSGAALDALRETAEPFDLDTEMNAFVNAIRDENDDAAEEAQDAIYAEFKRLVALLTEHTALRAENAELQRRNRRLELRIVEGREQNSRLMRSVVAEELLTVRVMQKINASRSARWMAGSPGWTTLEIAGELAGEVGELANVCKKLRRSEMGVPGNKLSDDELRQQARSEMADVFIVLMLTASKLGVDLYDAVCDTFNAKSEQMGFPERFSPTPFAARRSPTTRGTNG